MDCTVCNTIHRHQAYTVFQCLYGTLTLGKDAFVHVRSMYHSVDTSKRLCLGLHVICECRHEINDLISI